MCATCGMALVSTGDPHVLLAGTLLHGGTYEVGGCAGHGGFWITYRATDRKHRRTVAIKDCPDDCARQGTTVKPSGGWTAVLTGAPPPDAHGRVYRIMLSST